jgi:hypothetical protein
MKAKEYVAKFPPAENDEHLVDILASLVDETVKLTLSRKAQTPKALLAVYREQQQKWRAILGLLGRDDEHHRNLYRGGITAAVPAWGELLEMTEQAA